MNDLHQVDRIVCMLCLSMIAFVAVWKVPEPDSILYIIVGAMAGMAGNSMIQRKP